MAEVAALVRTIGIIVSGIARAPFAGSRAEHILLAGQRRQFGQGGRLGRGGRRMKKRRMRRGEEKLKEERRGACEKRERARAP
jgi:hypothetical protein